MIRAMFGSQFRGFRLVNVAALGLAAAMALGVYWAKTSAAREAAAITDVQHQIQDEDRRTRLLDAEISHLERPDRLTALAESRPLPLAPVPVDRETTPDTLAQIAARGATP
jgi:hypothetical protein